MNKIYIDMFVVLFYFLVILTAGYLVAKKHRKDSAVDFLTGGHSLNWFKTALTLIAMGDIGTLGVAGIGFVWGMAIQWNAVNLWINGPLAAMFIIPIYWRSKIVTTPELLEKRFNVSCRSFFSVVMCAYMIIVLGTSIYLGALLLNEIFGWHLYLCCIAIMAITGFYILTGGMKTVLSINVYQSIFITLTFIFVACVVIYKVGGISAIAGIKLCNEAGLILPSTLMPVDFSIDSKLWYPLPSGFIWAVIAGTAWIACNFGMAQRLLAAKNEREAQKAMLFTGFGVTILFTLAYMVGVSVRILMPDIMPDKAYVKAVMDLFPVGLRGLIIAGLIASLFCTIDGLVTASSTMVTQDIFLRFIWPGAGDKKTKMFARVIQLFVIISALLLIPFAAESKTIVKFIQSAVADMFGVVAALYLVGIFSTRATGKAALISMVSGIGLAIYLDFGTDISFPNVGVFSFVFSVIAALALSRFEKPLTRDRLKNLTVFTLTDAKGPFVGLAAWPNIWKAIAGLAGFWLILTVAWEIYIRSI
ncbi:MAG: sodium/solute symporter [Sedimentisphaerales bacterium]